MAAKTNSSWAPWGPRSRSRPSFRMRLRCANRISIFLRSRRDCSKASVSAKDRATSRACSWMSRGILRNGTFGQHSLSRADFGLPNGAGGLDVNDDAELHVDEIVVGISKECRSLVSAGPLRRGIGRRNELRDNLAGGAPRRIVEGRQILLHRAAGPRRITILAPILTCDRALLIGIRLDQARIDRKAFAANQTGRDARLDDSLEHVAENISITKTLVAGARKCRMIRDSVLDSKLAEPAIGQVHLHFTADPPLRADRKHVPHDQHPDHQFWIDRRAAHRRIVRCKFAAKPGQIESRIDLPHQVILRDSVVELKLVEKLRLFALQSAHHGLPLPRFASARWNHGSPHASTDFCNKIGHKPTWLT